MDWFEGLVSRENAGEVELVRAGFLADLRNEPRHGNGESRPMVLDREGHLFLRGAPRRS